MKKNYCEYCYPVKNSYPHWVEKLESFWQLSYISAPKARLNINKFRNILFKTLLVFGLYTKILIKSNVVNKITDSRTQLLSKSTIKNKIDLKMISLRDKESSIFVAKKSDKTIYFETLPTLYVGAKVFPNIDNKQVFKKILQQNNFNFANGQIFFSRKKAKKYVASKLGYPVVVKPVNGSLSMHITTNINSAEELDKAIDVVKKISTYFVVERFIKGEVYRLLCLNGRLWAASRRLPPKVIGDGRSTLSQLIQKYNKQNQKMNLAKVSIDNNFKKILYNQGLNLKTVLPKNKNLILIDKIILAAGGRQIDIMDEISPEITKQAERLADLCGQNVIGFDLITKSISKSKNGDYAFIEANSLPFFSMHHNADKIADQIWKIAFK